MVMTGELNWIFWTLGGLLGLGGFVLLWWALFADRSKGRKRCPKCWYNMSHTPSLTCSECGYTAKREKKLCKTHRRWRWAIFAVLVLIGSASSSLTPKVKRDGWLSIVPTTALILLATDQDIPQTQSLAFMNKGMVPNVYNPTMELINRINERNLWSWQWRLLANQQHPGNDASWIIDFSAREAWPVSEPFYATIGLSNQLQNQFWSNSSVLRVQVKADLPSAMTWEREIHSSYWTLTYRNNSKNVITINAATTVKWTDPSHLVGIVPEGEQGVTLNVTLERRDDSYDDDKPWTLLWEGEYQYQLDVHGSISDLLRPIDSLQLKDALAKINLSIERRGVRYDPELLLRIEPWTFGTFALKFELFKNDKLIRETEAWWAMEDVAEYVPGNLYPLYHLMEWNTPLPKARPFVDISNSWSMRVSAVPRLALRHVPRDPNMKGLRQDLGLEEIDVSGDYIPGDITYKLRLIDSQLLWIVDQ